MSDYLRHVALRTAGVSPLRPRVPSRFEPLHGMGLGENRTGGETVEHEIAAPRGAAAPETRRSLGSAPDRLPGQPVTRHEPGAIQPVSLSHTNEVHTRELRTIERRRVEEATRPVPQRETRPERDEVRDMPRSPERHRPAEKPPRDPEMRVRPPNEKVVVEVVRDIKERVYPPIEPSVHPADSSLAQFPMSPRPLAEAAQNRDQPTDAGRWPSVAQSVSGARDSALPATRAPGTESAEAESAPPSVHVVIGKVTVQAILPAPRAPIPARPAASSGPRLTLERYLEQRGGRA